MNPSPQHRPLLDLLLSVAGFSVALAVHSIVIGGGLEPGEAVIGTLASSLVFWLALQLTAAQGDDLGGAVTAFLERSFLGSGLNLILHSIMTYALYMRRTPFLVVAGSMVAAALVSGAQYLLAGQRIAARKTLLIGCDTATMGIAVLLGDQIRAYVSDPADPTPPLNHALILSPSEIPEFVERERPTNILVGTVQWPRLVSPEFLLKAKSAGIIVEDSPSVYEAMFSRICCTRLRPMDFLLSASLRGDARTMAIQAVYNNLIGLFFLLSLSPLILLVSLGIWLGDGPGPIIESVECAGFQHIPFRRQRFRTMRADGSGLPSRFGERLERWRLADLPQLFNVVRGEMALVGPRPVRLIFADALTAAMPFFSHRFSVKPGIIGWAQTQEPTPGLGGKSSSETDTIEYDLYYIKQGSLWMDVEILVNALVGGRKARVSQRPAVALNTGHGIG